MKMHSGNVGIIESNAVSFSSRGEHHSSDDLTCREKQVVVGICRAFSNKQIGDMLGVSEPTVHSHIRSVMAKSSATPGCKSPPIFGFASLRRSAASPWGGCPVAV